MLAADLGADWAPLFEPTAAETPDDVQAWESTEVLDDGASFEKSEQPEFGDAEDPTVPKISLLSLIQEETPPGEELYIRFRSFDGDDVEAKDWEEGEIVEVALFDLASASGPADEEAPLYELFSLENDAPFAPESADAPDLAALTGEVFLGSGWHNVDAPHDVNADGHVSPIDALLLITYLNNEGVGEFGEGEAPSYYPDIDGDGQLAPIDALLLFNYLNDNLPSLASQQFATDEALSEDELAGLVATRMAISEDAFADEKLDGASFDDAWSEDDWAWNSSDKESDDAVLDPSVEKDAELSAS